MRPILTVVLGLLTGCASYRDADVAMTTQAIDPADYAGRWYEIARFPVWFQRGCTATTATYEVLDEGTLRVVNACRTGGPDEPVERIEGTAEVVGPGRLEVRLGSIPFAAPYHVLWVDAGYDTAVVGVPNGRAGWILARNPEIAPGRLDEAKAVLRANGYDTQVTMTGGQLSGGQIQRVGLARALFGDPVILVLDEPNSNLDNEGSKALNEAIRQLKAQNRAVLIMAHRPAAIQECDKLLVLDGGVVRAVGPRDEVLRKMVRNHEDIQSAAAPGGVA